MVNEAYQMRLQVGLHDGMINSMSVKDEGVNQRTDEQKCFLLAFLKTKIAVENAFVVPVLLFYHLSYSVML